MFSKDDLVKQYETLTDEELFSNYKQLDTLSTDGQNALLEVIEKKGGIERLTDFITNKSTQRPFTEVLLEVFWPALLGAFYGASGLSRPIGYFIFS